MSYASNIQRQLKDQLQFFEETFEDQTLEHCLLAPAPGAWSALDCISHLNLAMDVTQDEIDKRITRALAKGQRPNEHYRPGFLGQRFARLLAPRDGDVRRRFKTFKRFKPMVRPGTENQILDGFRQRIARLGTQVETSTKVDLNRCRTNSNFGPIVRFKLGDTFPIILAHNERHLIQARKALQLT